jgi:hypothetical protein
MTRTAALAPARIHALAAEALAAGDWNLAVSCLIALHGLAAPDAALALSGNPALRGEVAWALSRGFDRRRARADVAQALAARGGAA